MLANVSVRRSLFDLEVCLGWANLRRLSSPLFPWGRGYASSGDKDVAISKA